MTEHIDPEREAIQAKGAPLLVKFTMFADYGASEKTEQARSWDDLVKRLKTVRKIYPEKSACPWIKLATFGDKRSPKNSLRHDANVLAISGVEGDYDLKTLSMAELRRCWRTQASKHFCIRHRATPSKAAALARVVSDVKGIAADGAQAAGRAIESRSRRGARAGVVRAFAILLFRQGKGRNVRDAASVRRALYRPV